MNIIQAIVLGVLQGATEFIPVSSSGHLVLVPWLLGWAPSGLAFTVVVHLGTVFGVLTFFWQDWFAMFRGGIEWAQTRRVTPALRMFGLLVLATIPAAILGLLFQSVLERMFQNPLFAAIMLLVTAALLLIGDRIGRSLRDVESMTWYDSLIVGLAQAVAILPGISRSGSTIAAARLRDVERGDSARFSFMLSLPIILGAGLVQLVELIRTGMSLNSALPLIAGFAAAFVSAYFVIRWMLNYLRSRSLTVFAAYCVVASLVSIAVYLIRG